jgi:arylsulfatase A-like enzyme
MALGGKALALPHWLRGAVKGRTSEKPNIIFVLFDDMGWGQPPSYRAFSISLHGQAAATRGKRPNR